ncbi:hypothetical protein ACFLS8_02830 [Chloroflexota bacterium]
MEEVLALIDKIIAEHKLIIEKAQSLEQIANDTEAMAALEKAKDTFIPGRFEQKEELQGFREILEAMDQGVKAHFKREETGLLAAFEKHGGKELLAALRALLLEHAELRERLAHSKKHVAELIDGGLSQHLWQASAHDMRAHISHTRKLLAGHAENEQKLLRKLRDRLAREDGQK